VSGFDSIKTEQGLDASMIRKTVQRFSEKIMLNQKPKA
jgi:hypothetical protein